MNSMSNLVEEPISCDVPFQKMEHAIRTAVDEIAADTDVTSSGAQASADNPTANVHSSCEVALPVSDDWGARSYVQIVVLMSATSLGLYICFMMAVPFLSPIAWSVALAVVCVPLQRRIEALVRSPGLAAGISVFLIGAVSLIFVIFVGQRLAQEASSGTQVINTRIESGEWRRAIEQHPRLIPVADWVEQQNLPATVKSTVTWMSTTGAGFVRGSVVELVSVLLTFYLLFFLLRDRRAAVSALRTSLPLSSAEMDRMLHRVGDTLHATIYGTLIVASVQGFLGGLMFWFLGLSAPLLWGVVMGLLAIIPILGAFVVWIPATLFLAAERWWQALILALWGVIVVGTIDNLLRPILVGRRLQLPTVLAFISVVGGIAVFGSSGLILGPVALTVTMVLLEIWPHRILVKDLPSMDSNAIDRFVNEGGPPAAILNSSGDD